MSTNKGGRPKKKHPGGRPSKMTPETIKKLEEVFAIDGSVGEACYYAGISTVTYYEWIKNNQELANRFQSLRERPVLKARQTVVKALEDPNFAFKYLEKKRKKEFGNALDVTTQGEKLMILPAELSLKNEQHGPDVQG